MVRCPDPGVRLSVFAGGEMLTHVPHPGGNAVRTHLVNHLILSDSSSLDVARKLDVEADQLRFDEEGHVVKEGPTQNVGMLGGRRVELAEAIGGGEEVGEHAFVVVLEAVVYRPNRVQSCAGSETIAPCDLEDEGEGEACFDVARRRSGEGP